MKDEFVFLGLTFLKISDDYEIPINKEGSFLTIKKSEAFSYTLDLCTDFFDPKLDLVNLFLAIKSFLEEDSLIIKKLVTTTITSQDLRVVTDSFQISLLKSLTFDNFRQWFQQRLLMDWKYTKFSEDYVISLMFDRNSLKGDMEINWHKLKPIYPWKGEIERLLKEKTVEELKLEIKELRERLAQLGKKKN